jgi:hypothetical protein
MDSTIRCISLTPERRLHKINSMPAFGKVFLMAIVLKKAIKKAGSSTFPGSAGVKQDQALAEKPLAAKMAATALPTEKQGSSKAVPVTFRIPAKVLKQVDEAVQQRKIKIPRHTWLLEAVIEKLDRLELKSN